MSDPDRQTDFINAQVIGFPAPGQIRLLIGPGSGFLDGGVPVDISLDLVPAELRVDGQMVIAVFHKDTLEILAVEPFPEIETSPYKKCESCNGTGLHRDPDTGLLTNDKCAECGGDGCVLKVSD